VSQVRILKFHTEGHVAVFIVFFEEILIDVELGSFLWFCFGFFGFAVVFLVAWLLLVEALLALALREAAFAEGEAGAVLLLAVGLLAGA
jgi:hypothetical protein